MTKKLKVHNFKGIGSGVFPKLTAGLNTMLLAMNLNTVDRVRYATDDALLAVPGVGPKKLGFIRRMYGRVEEIRLPTKAHVVRVVVEQAAVDDEGLQSWSYDIYVAPLGHENRVKLVQTRNDVAVERDHALIVAGIDVGNAGIYPLTTRRAEEVSAAASRSLIASLQVGHERLQ